MNVPGGPDWTTVGSEFRERRMRLNLNQDELAAAAGVHRDTVSAIELGQGSPRTRKSLDETLSRMEAEAGLPPLTVAQDPAPDQKMQHPAPGVVRVTVEGVYGAKALIVEAPPENLPELEAMVDRIMRNLRGDEGTVEPKPMPQG